jgi:hypothetical protein
MANSQRAGHAFKGILIVYGLTLARQIMHMYRQKRLGEIEVD